MKRRLLFLRSQQKLFEVQTRLYLVTPGEKKIIASPDAIKMSLAFLENDKQDLRCMEVEGWAYMDAEKEFCAKLLHLRKNGNAICDIYSV